MSSPSDQGKPSAGGPRLVTDVDLAIPKPDPFAGLERFRAKRDPAVGTVEVLLTALPVHPIAQARDFVKLHPDENTRWSPPLCFIPVPVRGQRRDSLHIIDEEIALRYLPGGRIQRFRLALATKPHDVFFLACVPCENLDNSWNLSNLTGCEEATRGWVQLSSRRAEGVDSYRIEHAMSEKAFPPPKWPTQTLGELITVTFAGRMIDRDDHPALLRLRGAEQDLK
jgi:hypothetical protein